MKTLESKMAERQSMKTQHYTEEKGYNFPQQGELVSPSTFQMMSISNIPHLFIGLSSESCLPTKRSVQSLPTKTSVFEYCPSIFSAFGSSWNKYRHSIRASSSCEECYFESNRSDHENTWSTTCPKPAGMSNVINQCQVTHSLSFLDHQASRSRTALCAQG